MDRLTLEQADQIILDIRRQEITFSHLFDELVDHVCCDVDHEMQKGLSFAEAYRKVKQKIGARGLKKIQEDTLYAVDSKYRKMKNTMKISGVAGTVLLGFAAMFKIQHWPGAGYMITLGALLLAFVFLPSALVVLWKETRSSKRLFIFISAFVAGVFYILGMMFKIQHWPGAGVVISLAVLSGLLLFLPSLLISKLSDPEKKHKRPVYIIGFLSLLLYLSGFWFKIMHWPLAGAFMSLGSFVLFVVVFPWYTWITWKEEGQVTKEYIFMVVASLFFVVPAALITLNLQSGYDEGFFTQQEQQQSMANYLEKNNAAFLDLYRDSVSYKAMEQVHNCTCVLMGQIGQLETRIIDLGRGFNGKASHEAMNYRELGSPFLSMPAQTILLPSCPPRQELEAEMVIYKDTLASIVGEAWLQSYHSLLNTAVYLPSENPAPNELALINSLHALTLLKNAVFTVEGAAFRQLAKKEN
jgi:hypothetical protein